MIDLSVDIRNSEEVKRAFKAMGKSMKDVRVLRKMIRPGAKPIRDAIRAATPKGDKVHYSYRKKRRISTFIPGHLIKSTQDISNRKRGYKKLPVIYIGPVFTGNAGKGGTFGANVAAVDAYYAHMVYGSAAAYEKRVIQAGFQAGKSAAEGLILAETDRVINEQGKKAGLR